MAPCRIEVGIGAGRAVTCKRRTGRENRLKSRPGKAGKRHARERALERPGGTHPAASSLGVESDWGVSFFFFPPPPKKPHMLRQGRAEKSPRSSYKTSIRTPTQRASERLELR